jgi:hypothetical protein
MAPKTFPPGRFNSTQRTAVIPQTEGVLMMQILAKRDDYGYFSNQNCCILQYITDSIRLIPLCILLLLHWLCPAKSFFENTTLGVSHYETYRSRLRRRHGPHRSSCHHSDLFRLHPEQGHRCAHQHAACTHVPSQRSERLWHGSRSIRLSRSTKPFFNKELPEKQRGPIT